MSLPPSCTVISFHLLVWPLAPRRLRRKTTDREVKVNDAPRSSDLLQLAEQNTVELDHNEQNASNLTNLNLKLFPIFSNNGIGEHNLSSEAQNPSQQSKREKENFRKPGRNRKVKVCPPPRNNFKITDLFKPNPKLNSNSEGPNEPVVVVIRSEETDTSSVLDESAVTRPRGF